VAGREVADVEWDPAEPPDLHHGALREEPVGDATLIEHLDRAGVETSRSRSVDLLRRPPLHHDDVCACERQLPCEHEARRTSACDHYCVRHHGHSSPC
jgi:hypothetical protein